MTFCYAVFVKLPLPLQKAYDLWMLFSKALGRVMSWILLTILWVTVFGIYAIVLKLIKFFKTEPAPATYWHPLEPEPAENMRRPF